MPGCGTGQSTFVLSEYFDRVLGVDVSESQIEEARDDIILFLRLIHLTTT